MEDVAYQRMLSLAGEPDAVEATERYLSEKLKLFLKRQERFLICFPKRGPNDFGVILEKAVRAAGGIPMFWGPDFRWKALLKQAFASKATAIAGPPPVILGLTKLTRAMGTPLYARNVLLSGYPCPDWMTDGIARGLDSRTWFCYGPGTGPVVWGFSCDKTRGIHLRTDLYGVEVLGKSETSLPEGRIGRIVLYPREAPDARLHTREWGKLETAPCTCGSPVPRLLGLTFQENEDRELSMLRDQLLAWTSILDCRLVRGEYGLELELVTFPGEKLPKLPSCAKQIIRSWDPDRDMPFRMCQDP